MKHSLISAAAVFLVASACTSKMISPPAEETRKPDSELNGDGEQCLRAIKAELLTGPLHFVPVADSDAQKAIRDSERPFGANAKMEFLATSPKDRLIWTKFSSIASEVAPSHTRETSVSISRSDESNFVFSMNVRAVRTSLRKSGGESTAFAQTFGVDENCQRHLISSSLLKSMLDGTKFTGESKDIYPATDGERVDVKRGTPPIPAGKYVELRDLSLMSIAELLKIPSLAKDRTPLLYAGTEAGWIDLEIQPTTTVDLIGGDYLPLLGVQAKLLYQGAVVDTAVRAELLGGGKSLIIDETTVQRTEAAKVWMDQNLVAKYKDSAMKVEVSSGANLQEANLELEYSTMERMTFPNLGAYWKTTPHAAQPPMKFAATMKSVPKIDYSAAAPPSPRNLDDRYLSESTYLDFSSQTVQDQLALLRAKITPGMSRADIVREIVKFLPSVLHFDERMTSDGSYKFNMKSSEIISRGKAVCQHFVNLFTTFARALGVPSRIIGGLNLFGTSSGGFHAWNEFEIEPGRWVPVEPQDPTMNFVPSHYIPLFIQHYEAHPFHQPVLQHYLFSWKYQIRLLRSSSRGPL